MRRDRASQLADLNAARSAAFKVADLKPQGPVIRAGVWGTPGLVGAPVLGAVLQPVTGDWPPILLVRHHLLPQEEEEMVADALLKRKEHTTCCSVGTKDLAGRRDRPMTQRCAVGHARRAARAQESGRLRASPFVLAFLNLEMDAYGDGSEMLDVHARQVRQKLYLEVRAISACDVERAGVRWPYL